MNTTLVVAPAIPSKWEIIPIHNSDRGAFKRCRRYWDWSSPARHNLMLRADVHGINNNLWFGTGVHYALEQFYTPGLRRDPVEAWKTWFDIQWRGGIVTEDWLDKVYDLKPQPVTKPGTYHVLGTLTNEPFTPVESDLWKVRGLEDILPDPDHNEYDELFVLGTKMMEFYKDYAARMDDFEVILPEHIFSVPIWDFDNDRILKAVDVREDSPNYGKELEVHARGRMDGIWVKPNGKLGIIDHKTAISIGEDYFRKLETDEQCTAYLWAAQVEASYYDLPHKGEPLEKVIYNVLRKAYPKPPTMLKNGMFSIDRENESCNYEMLMAWAQEYMPGIPFNPKQQAYADWLKDVGDEQFIIRRDVPRNAHQLYNMGYRTYLEALDMLNEPRIYPTIDNDYLCLGCQFRSPCLAREDGGDWEQLIRDNYSSNKDR